VDGASINIKSPANDWARVTAYLYLMDKDGAQPSAGVLVVSEEAEVGILENHPEMGPMGEIEVYFTRHEDITTASILHHLDRILGATAETWMLRS
jgi:hypothetical protein